MIDFLIGVPGKIKAVADYLLNNLSVLRAAKIEFLDAYMTSRAPAATALSNATWTDVRAAKLDSITTSFVKSITTFVVQDTISSGGQGNGVTYTFGGAGVNISKTVVLSQLGSNTGVGCYAYLVSTTVVKVDSASAGAVMLRVTLLEFY